MLALVNALKALPCDIQDCRVNALVDSKVLIDTWEGQGSKKSPELTSVNKKLFFVFFSRNIQISLTHVPSSKKPADGPSRRLSHLDSRLSREAWERVEKVFGGPGGHSFQLMALDSNVMLGRNGSPLPHFSPHPIHQSAGVNLFSQNLLEFESMSDPYVFPPFELVGPVLKFLYPFRIPIRPLRNLSPQPCRQTWLLSWYGKIVEDEHASINWTARGRHPVSALYVLLLEQYILL